jgi:hypothetical protein
MDYVLQMIANPILFKPPPLQKARKCPNDSKNICVRALSVDIIHYQLMCPWDTCSSIHNFSPTKKVLLYLHGNNEDILTSTSYRQWIANNTNSNILTYLRLSWLRFQHWRPHRKRGCIMQPLLCWILPRPNYSKPLLT